MGMLISILIGALAGLIAGKLMNYGLGLIWAIIVGVVGGFLGSWIFHRSSCQLQLLGPAPRRHRWCRGAAVACVTD